MTSNRPALFLDRDGVIIENRANYVRSWDDVTFLPQAVSALAALGDVTHQVVIITNQSAIGRGLISAAVGEALNQRVIDYLRRAGARIDAAYICPHAPAAGCRCRKPAPGMLLQAVAELGIDLPRSLMIGDALTDVEAGQRAGVGRTALVRTGRGRVQEQLPQAARLAPFAVFENLAHALETLLDPPLPAADR